MIKLSKPIISEEAIQAVTDVLRTGMLVQGKYVTEFEHDLKEYMSAQYALAVSSGTAALHIALAALEIGKGDAVFIPAFTFPATANVVELQKAQTVLVDVNPSTYNIDPVKLEDTILNYSGNKTPKAIIVVHEFGAPANMTQIMDIAKRYNLFVIEDAACALGTTWNGQHVGTFGDVGCFSWHPRKAITTGEGGAVVTNSEKLNEKIKLLRNHGLEKSINGSIDFLLPGFNYRLTDFQAVLGLHQLKNFDEWVEKRRELVDYYFECLQDCSVVTLPDKIDGHSWQTFMVKVDQKYNRNLLIKKLKDAGIETNLGAQAIHMLAYYKEKFNYNDKDYPNANASYQQGLAFPLHPELTKQEIHYVINEFKKIIMR
ncbi:DegT/DnrJ/EryC1/StrS aminotransferase family protein [Bacillus sp. REN10]|uniref:DegT/DnrJ/EryC1/StrS family aminotransferase n=1 Tax=Bacillus sp. REN10 TaxID=2782541 RepID=UPI00193C5DDB|nr:DegT/DnrJ/EryC1/StrS aminotransferase family protein [Bacillus sp. REN10]